jgi:hypothetical protein
VLQIKWPHTAKERGMKIKFRFVLEEAPKALGSGEST